MLMDNAIIMVIDQMWYQRIWNDESNNVLIEKEIQKIIFISIFGKFSIKPDQKSSFFNEIGH